MYSRKAIVWSVALHVLVVLVLIVSVDFSPNEIRQPAARQEIVQATVVDSAAIAQEVERLKAADAQKKAAEDAQARALENKRKAEEQRVKELKAEQERLKRAEAEAQQKKKVAEEQAKEAQRKQAEAERQRKAEEAKRAQAETERKKAEAERKKAEQAAEREAAEAEQKRAAEALRKKQEAEAREAERKRIEQALQDELAAEEAAQQAAAQAQADAREIDKYSAAIYSRVKQFYTILPGLEGLNCTLRIRLIPGGEVAGVEIVKSSGNATFDRQAETAVRKASPLPVPSDPKLFQQMRSIQFVFDPQH